MEKNPTWMPVVALALRDGQGLWLMHRRPAHKHHGGLWEFPGGKVEPTEIPTQALEREILEELDIRVEPDCLFPAGFAEGGGNNPGAHIVILLYTCRKWTGHAQSLEGGEVAWFSAAEIEQLAKPPLDIALAAQLFAQYPG